MKQNIMKIISFVLVFVFILGLFPTHFISAGNEYGTSSTVPSDEEDWDKLIIPYSSATSSYSHEGTPIGNGYFGAKQSGGITEDTFQLNDKGFWSGDPQFTNDVRNGTTWLSTTTHESRFAALEKTKQLLQEAYVENISSDDRLAKMKAADKAAESMWSASYQATFLPLGNLKLSFPELSSGTTNYKRELHMDEATALVSFQKDGVTYTRESFASHPDKVMVVKIANDGDIPMTMGFTMELPSQMVGKATENKVVVKTDTNEVVMTGRAPVDKMNNTGTWFDDRGIVFEARVKAIATGGVTSEENGKLIITGATEIVLIYSSQTSYKDSFTDPSNSGIDVAGVVRAAIDNAEAKGYQELLNTHHEDFRSLFRKLWIELGGSSIRAGGTDISPWEFARHYQYSRYIMIAVERENTGNIPHNLLGLWNHEWNPANQGAYFLNENLQKMHALVGAANLTETSEPLWEWIKSIADDRSGGETARESYGIDNAWTVSHSSDIWAKSDLYGESTRWANWTSGGIWLMNDLYDAFEYTQDVDFLQDNYPIFEGATRFALGTLMEVDGVDGELTENLVIAPSTSPEHWFLTDSNSYLGAVDISTAGDVQLYMNLFNILERAAKRLEAEGITVDMGLVQEAKEASAKMIPLENYIVEDTGRFKEWYNEYRWGEAHHRHASHLLGLFVDYVGINAKSNPTVFEALQKELQRLSSTGGGYHPDTTTMAINAGLPSWGFSKMSMGVIGTNYKSGDVMHWCPIGAPIAEAILDSKNDELDILSQLPSEWSSGKIVGIRGRGGYQLSVSWSDGALEECVIDSPSGTTPFVRYKGKGVNLGTDERFTVNRATTTLDKLITEANQKLGDPFSDESKQVLREALASNDYQQISKALLDLEPVETLVTVTAANGKTTLREIGETLQLTATSDSTNPSYVWTVTAVDGSATEVATITQDGLLTAVNRGKILAKAMLRDGSGAIGSLEINVVIPAAEKMYIDDRHPDVIYSTGWDRWEEGKHHDGTITYTRTLGNTASLTFEGTGIEFVSGKAGHMGAFSVTIDGEIVEPIVDLYYDGGEYNTSVYELLTLESGEHTITITNVDNPHRNTQMDIDAFIVHNLVPESEYQINSLVSGGTCAVTTNPPATAYEGEFVAIAIDEIEDGKRISEITVKDADENLVSLKMIEEHASYSFLMPASAANIHITLVDDTVPDTQYTISVSGGQSDKASAAEGETVTLIADEPPVNHFFVKWLSDDVAFDNPSQKTTSFVMPAHDVAVTAHFEEDKTPEATYYLSVVAGTGGTVDEAVSGYYTAGESISLTAHPSENCQFDHWISSEDDMVFDDSSQTTTIIMPAQNVTVTAQFKPNIPVGETYFLSVVAGTGGTVDAAVSGDYSAGESISLTAQPNENYRFDRWSSSTEGVLEDSDSQTTTIIMPAQNVTVTALFKPNIPVGETYFLSVVAGTGGTVDEAVSGYYKAGESISLTAQPNENYRFDQWSSLNGGRYTDITSMKTTFFMPTNDVEIIAQFSLKDLPTKEKPEVTQKRSSAEKGTSTPDVSPALKSAYALKNKPLDLSMEQALLAMKEAIETTTKNKGSSVQVIFKNIGTIELATLQAIHQKALQQTNLPVTILADTLSDDGKSIVARIYVNPANATQSLSLFASRTSKEATQLATLISKFFRNKFQVISLNHQGDFGSGTKIAVKIDSTLSSENLVLYSYNREDNKYHELHVPMRLDKNGYLHFPLTKGGDIIISDGVLIAR